MKSNCCNVEIYLNIPLLNINILLFHLKNLAESNAYFLLNSDDIQTLICTEIYISNICWMELKSDKIFFHFNQDTLK